MAISDGARNPADTAYYGVLAAAKKGIDDAAARKKIKVFTAQGAKNAIEQVEDDVRKVLGVLEEVCQQQTEGVQKQYEQGQQSNKELRERIDGYEAAAGELQKKLDEAGKAQEGLEHELREYGQQASISGEKLRRQQQYSAGLEGQLAEKAGEIQTLQTDLQEARVYSVDLQSELTQTSHDYAALVWAIAKALPDGMLDIMVREKTSREKLHDSKLALEDAERAKQIGNVIDSFPNFRVAHVELTKSVKVGDWISIRSDDEGNLPAYEQQLNVLQVGYDKVERAIAGDVIIVNVGRDLIKTGYKAYRV